MKRVFHTDQKQTIYSNENTLMALIPSQTSIQNTNITQIAKTHSEKKSYFCRSQMKRKSLNLDNSNQWLSSVISILLRAHRKERCKQWEEVLLIQVLSSSNSWLIKSYLYSWALKFAAIVSLPVWAEWTSSLSLIWLKTREKRWWEN